MELLPKIIYKKPADNIVLAKNGVNTVFENSFSNIRKKFFRLLIFRILVSGKIFAQARFSFENLCKVARSSPILFPLAVIVKRHRTKIDNGLKSENIRAKY